MAHKKVTAAPTLKDWAGADDALRQIHEAGNTLAEMEAEKNRRIDTIKQEYGQMALPLQNRIKRLEADLREYAGAHRMEMEGKSKRLTFGTVGYRQSSRIIVPPARIPDIIAQLRGMGLKECIQTKEVLDKDALRRQSADVLMELGISIKQSDDFYYDIDHDDLADIAQ